MSSVPLPLNAFTVDVEDYFHVSAFEGIVDRGNWDHYPSRVEANTCRLLDVLERHNVRATFFVLGWVAHRFPLLVKKIASRGHEIACHSYWHRLLYRLNPREFRQDLREARSILEDVCGERVTTFRAPSWSLTRQTYWSLEILGDEGFRVDSSVFPVYHDRYGIPDAPRFPYRVRAGGGTLWEFPASVVRCLGINFPVAGGGYFRLYPLQWTLRAIKSLNRRGHPFLFFIHPWELDPDQPRVDASLRRRWRHYVNLASTERKLNALLERFRFGRLSDVLASYTDEPSAPGQPTNECAQPEPDVHCQRTVV